MTFGLISPGRDDVAFEWKAAQHQTGAPTEKLDADVIKKRQSRRCSPRLETSRPHFAVAEWRSVKDWATKLLNKTSGEIAFSQKHDLRHALNAAWIAG